VLVRSESLAGEVAAIFARNISPRQAWRLELSEGGVT